MSTIKVDTIQNTSGVEVYTVKAWVTFSMDGSTSVINSENVSSLTDGGTGSPLFTMSNAIASANGSTWNTPALNSGGAEKALQSGARINTTTQWEGFCAGDTAASASDWDLGYSGVIR